MLCHHWSANSMHCSLRYLHEMLVDDANCLIVLYSKFASFDAYLVTCCSFADILNRGDILVAVVAQDVLMSDKLRPLVQHYLRGLRLTLLGRVDCLDGVISTVECWSHGGLALDDGVLEFLVVDVLDEYRLFSPIINYIHVWRPFAIAYLAFPAFAYLHLWPLTFLLDHV